MSKPERYDYAGWATCFNVRCSDGRTIKEEAFKHMDGARVPLVWSHRHDEPEFVLGHADLEFRPPKGMWAYLSFNDTERGRTSKEQVAHGDIGSLSIYANQLKQDSAKNVLHGEIREVSLVLAGANPSAKIDFSFAHSEDMDLDDVAAVIFNEKQDFEIFHEEKVEEVKEEIKEEPKMEEPKIEEPKVEEIKHAEESKTSEDETLKDVYETLDDKQKKLVDILVALASQNKNSEEDPEMKQSAFENETKETVTELSHDELAAIFAEAKRGGSLADAFLAHGITNIEYFFPDAKFVGKVPEEIDRDQEWVASFMSKVKKVPFSRIKSVSVDLTPDEARAKGYVKGSQKVAEVIAAAKRETTPTTIYKLQKFDRDDIVDLENGGLDAISYIKGEMAGKLKEEDARAMLVGDGRSVDSADKVNPLNIRPIWQDNPLYTVPVALEFNANCPEDAKAKQLIRAAVKARKEYKGSGKPVFYTTEDWLTSMLLIEDANGRVIYETKDKLATALLCSDIVAVPVMENLTRTDDTSTFDYELAAIIVNPSDYVMGMGPKGNATMFDDFDLNYNKQEYLIENRFSGALVKPHAALAIEIKTAHVGD